MFCVGIEEDLFFIEEMPLGGFPGPLRPEAVARPFQDSLQGDKSRVSASSFQFEAVRFSPWHRWICEETQSHGLRILGRDRKIDCFFIERGCSQRKRPSLECGRVWNSVSHSGKFGEDSHLSQSYQQQGFEWGDTIDNMLKGKGLRRYKILGTKMAPASCSAGPAP